MWTAVIQKVALCIYLLAVTGHTKPDNLKKATLLLYA